MSTHHRQITSPSRPAMLSVEGLTEVALNDVLDALGLEQKRKAIHTAIQLARRRAIDQTLAIIADHFGCTQDTHARGCPCVRVRELLENG